MYMTEIKAETGTAAGNVAFLADMPVSNEEMESLFAYLKGNGLEREKELASVSNKAKRMEEEGARLAAYYRWLQARLERRNRDLDALAERMEKL